MTGKHKTLTVLFIITVVMGSLLVWAANSHPVSAQCPGCDICTVPPGGGGAICEVSGTATAEPGTPPEPTQPPPQATQPPIVTAPPGTAGPPPTQSPPPTASPVEITPTPNPNATPTATPPVNECVREVCGGFSPFCPAPGFFQTTFVYDCDTGTYLRGSGNVGQLGDTCCSPTPTPVPPPEATPKASCPETFATGRGWGKYEECAGGFKLSVSAAIPAYRVWYTPYPRGLVYQQMQFNGDANPIVGNYVWSEPLDNWDPVNWKYDPDFRNFRIGIRWRQVTPTTPIPDAPPCWIKWLWDERPWGEPRETCSRLAPGATHTYETSSAGKPENGPNDLPSYQVQAVTYWVLDWKWQWEQYECVEQTENKFCVPNLSDGDYNLEQCTLPDGGQGHIQTQVICKKKDWVPHEQGGMCDLSKYGQPHTYVESYNIAANLTQPGTGLSVPVIEVQGVIQK